MSHAKQTILDRLLGRNPASAGGKEQTAVTAAEARLATCRENHERTIIRAAEAHGALRRATAVLRASVAEHDRAILLADREPSSANERAMEQAAAHTTATEATVAEKRNAAIDADEAVAGATRAVDDAEAELARAQRDAEIAVLRDQSGTAAFAVAIAGPAQRLLEARRTMLEAAGEIDAAFAASHAASARLREMGEFVRDLAYFHAMAPMVRASIAEDPARLGWIDRILLDLGEPLVRLGGMRAALESESHGPWFSRCFSKGMDTPSPEGQAGALENIEAALTGRDENDAHDRRNECGRRRQAARAATTQKPKPRHLGRGVFTFDPEDPNVFHPSNEG